MPTAGGPCIASEPTKQRPPVPFGGPSQPRASVRRSVLPIAGGPRWPWQSASRSGARRNPLKESQPMKEHFKLSHVQIVAAHQIIVAHCRKGDDGMAVYDSGWNDERFIAEMRANNPE